MSISDNPKENLSWWLSKEKETPFHFGVKKYQMELFSDALLEGWDCHNGETSQGGR